MRPGLAIALLAAWIAGAASAQDAAPEIPDVPSGPATLRGRVVHEERPDRVGDVSIVLYALDASGRPGSRRSETAPDGTFAFEGISNDPGVVYLVGARYQGLPFPGDRVVFEPGQTERTIEVRLFEPSEDLAAVHLEQSSLRVTLGVGRLLVAEVHRLRNDGDHVFYVPAEHRAERHAPLEAELLDGVEDFAMPLGVVPEGATRDGRDFAFWGPLYPGAQEISFRYEVPIETGVRTLVKRFPSAAEQIRVFGTESGPLKAVDGMKEVDVVEEGGQRFRPFEVSDPGAGFVARLELDVPEMRADPGALRLAEGQLVLEVDDATLQAQEQYRLEVDGQAVLSAEPGELLLSLALPEGAEDIRFSADASALGLVQTDEGVGLVGPIEPGSHGIGLAYTVRSGPDGVALERHYDRRLPLLRIFVADTGVAAASERLHRRRPVRDADRTYLIFEAFEVEPGEPVDLSLEALPPRAGAAGPALAAGVLVGLAAIVFLLAPLRGGDDEAAFADDDAAPRARDEREHLYESIRDLDHDYETGKLDEEGWRSLRGELRARAVTLLAEERAHAEASPPAAPAAPAPPATCRTCGAEPRPGDRFCAGCGAPLAASPAATSPATGSDGDEAPPA
ncbi:MAG TPA: hypothetical protein VKB65_07590 [Myxococcota bacterium]|nr:hypothetical protein [Myxococcota bacterium]